jgi:hypothetical protein
VALFNEVPVSVHPDPVSKRVKVTAPLPDPPDVFSVIGVPAVPVAGLCDTVNVA